MNDVNLRERSLFLKAIEFDSPDAAALFLDEACGDDRQLRQRVEALLQANQQSGDVFDHAATVTPAPITERPGDTIGPYKLLQQIGEGGMGVVYMAEQTEPVERRVALKIIKPGMDTRQVIARFEAERQALAMMDHPNIARVLDAGTTDTGRPYFVMELVKGLPITQYCDEQHLTPRERLELFLPICQAVQHAHQKGVIHRDLKPSNILVARYDDRAVPKIIDFGVAKAVSQRLTEKTMFTQYGQIVGTIEYMSPEQAQFNQLDVDTRSDIYSLGVLLYELLTGETPFDKQRLRLAAFDELLRIIREEEPPRPSVRLSTCATLPSVAANRHIEPHKLSTLVRGELDWIVMKALEKDRGRRYETASMFAADVQHYLNDEAVVACPPSAGYRFRKFARRNKATIATTAMVACVLVAGIIGTTWQAIEATQERDRAVIAEGLAETRLENEQRERARAEQAEAEVREALERETAQRQRADENFAIAREAVDEFLTHMSEEELKNLPGLQPIRRELLSAALSFHERFVADNADNRELRFELAEAYYRIAFVQVYLGDHASYFENTRRAFEMFGQLREEDPENDEVLRQIARIRHLCFRRYDEAIADYRELLARHPGDEEIMLALAQTLQHKSNTNLSTDERRTLLLEAEKLARQVLQLNPDSDRAPGKLIFILGSLGRVAYQTGDQEQALNYFESAANEGAAIVEQIPYAIELGHAAVLACSMSAACHTHLGNGNQVLAWRERQTELARLLAYSNPLIPEVWPDLYDAWTNLAREQEKQGRADDARRSLWRAADILDNLDGSTFEDRVFLASVYAGLSRVAADDEPPIVSHDRQHFRAQCVATLRNALSMPEEVRVGVSHQRMRSLATQLALDEDADDDALEVGELVAHEWIRLTPFDGAGAFSILGLMQHRRGDDEGAAASIAEALSRKSDNRFALVVAATIANDQDNQDAAQRFLARLEETNPGASTDEHFLALWSQLRSTMGLAARVDADEEE